MKNFEPTSERVNHTYVFIYIKPGWRYKQKTVYIYADRIENAVKLFRKRYKYQVVNDILRISKKDYNGYVRSLNLMYKPKKY